MTDKDKLDIWGLHLDGIGDTEISRIYEGVYSYECIRSFIRRKKGTHTAKAIKVSDEVKLLTENELDPNQWKITAVTEREREQYTPNDGVVTLKTRSITKKPLNDIRLETALKVFRELDREYKPPKVKYLRNKSGKLLTVNITDLHLGKLCWRGDTGEDYDIKIASARFLHIINDILTKVKDKKIEQILFIWSNDFFHFDTIDATTTAGTKQDTDVRWKKLYKTGVKLLIQGIDLLKEKAPVKTFYVGANHDKKMSFFALDSLGSWYRKEKEVDIDEETKERYCYTWGNVQLVYAHGSDISKKELPKLPSVEYRKQWGNSIYTEFHLAHYHSEQTTKEADGYILRVLSAPTNTDNWHYSKGFVGAVKKAEHFVYDKNLGLEQIIMTPIGG